jgi:hypothetical protein
MFVYGLIRKININYNIVYNYIKICVMSSYNFKIYYYLLIF